MKFMMNENVGKVIMKSLKESSLKEDTAEEIDNHRTSIIDELNSIGFEKIGETYYTLDLDRMKNLSLDRKEILAKVQSIVRNNGYTLEKKGTNRHGKGVGMSPSNNYEFTYIFTNTEDPSKTIALVDDRSEYDKLAVRFN